ncbi:hypothetical protein Ciccas_004284 [Cichlidogyrus casuarinus]|uniref:Uncharacterized protein n=1 Tax=Cichlidogyrus casuarinus TaxID=1844966 RepID=A0ABD2QCS9_9PLAT
MDTHSDAGHTNEGFESNDGCIQDKKQNLEIRTTLDDILPKSQREVERHPVRLEQFDPSIISNMAEPYVKKEDFDDPIAIIGMVSKKDVSKIERIQEWACANMWNHFLYTISPIDLTAWFSKKLPMKLLAILHAPLVLIFRLTIPIVLEELTDSTVVEDAAEIPSIMEDEAICPMDQIPSYNKSNPPRQSDPYLELKDITVSNKQVLDEEAMHGWCKILNCAHCIICPLSWTMLIASK